MFWAGVMLLAASLLPADTYFWWGGVALLFLPVLSASERRLPLNALSVALVLFCACLFANAVFFTPHYSAHGIYRPVTFFAGFAAAALLGREACGHVLRGGATLLSLLVLFGLMQVFFGFWPYENPERAAAAFVTPNTFATAINLFLLPLAALLVIGRGGGWGYAAALWLFAGLLSTQSRGGWIAFTAGLLFIVGYLGQPKTAKAWAHWIRLMAGLLAVAVAYYSVKFLAPALATPTGLGSLGGMLAEEIAGRGTSYRIALASVALELIMERPLAGAGAHTFWWLYEMVKPPELDLGMSFPYAHNDYLQTWVEYGLFGFVLLVAVVVAALTMILKGRYVQRDDPVPLVCGAAVAGILVHATVDFPLYVPFPIMVFGAWLGVLAAHGGDASWAARLHKRLEGFPLRIRAPLVKVAAGIAILAWVGQPAMGELAARRALVQLAAGNAGNGLYWQSVARRLEPRSGRRHWEEGVIWRDQALAAGNRALAAEANAIFAEGMRVDPYDINNFLERARLHRLHPDLFEKPASPEAIVEWSAQAVRLRPYLLPARAEYARALAYAGRAEEARRLARAMIAQHPDSQIARRLAAEM